jgi:hypothetical protein
MVKQQTFTLLEISNWSDAGTVHLPNVQRSFVWKPSQIENLWDSILRGYPVGAFVLAEKLGKPFELLDGQQRATAICLGFGSKTFRGSEKRIKVFIDLVAPESGDVRQYIVRVITNSHPWGYQKNDNAKPLDSDSIRRAMQLYGIEDHLDFPLDDAFPYEAEFPIPLEFFIQSESLDDLLTMIEKWSLRQKIESRWHLKQKHVDTEHSQPSPLDIYNDRIKAIFLAAKRALDKENGQKIPALYLNFEQFTDASISLKNDEKSAASAEIDDSNDEVENLFIRLNAGGTPLRGEELNYSILKAHIDKPLQVNIEKACSRLLQPSRFITIAFRLFQNKHQQSSRDAIQMRVKPKQFQKHLSENREEFTSFIEKILENKDFDGKTLLEHAKSLLIYTNQQTYGLPFPIVASLANRAPEIMFLLLYRLLVKKDDLTACDLLHKKMIGLVSLFLWFGKGDRQRDHAKLLANIWPAAKLLDEADLFWSKSTLQRGMLNNVLPNIPAPTDLESLIEAKRLNNKISLLESFQKKSPFGEVVVKAFANRDLILYAQRQFLTNTFKEQHFELDDTNVPFDWDHISPNKLVENKRMIPKAIKDWYNTNGNLRAWPYSLNRIDNDSIPEIKFDPLNANRHSPNDIEERWCKYFAKRGLVFNKKKLSKYLLEWSFCKEAWAKCKSKNMKNRVEWTEVCRLIVDRNISIYTEWYEQLQIGELIPGGTQADIGQIIDKRKWLKNPPKFNDLFEYSDDYDYWISSNPVNGTQLYVYLACPQAEDTEYLSMLEEDAIEFGLFEVNSSDLIRNVRIHEEQESRYEKYGDNLIYSQFTLVSDDKESHHALLKNFICWLQEFPSLENEQLVKFFRTLLKSNFKG